MATGDGWQATRQQAGVRAGWTGRRREQRQKAGGRRREVGVTGMREAEAEGRRGAAATGEQNLKLRPTERVKVAAAKQTASAARPARSSRSRQSSRCPRSLFTLLTPRSGRVGYILHFALCTTLPAVTLGARFDWFPRRPSHRPAMRSPNPRSAPSTPLPALDIPRDSPSNVGVQVPAAPATRHRSGTRPPTPPH